MRKSTLAASGIAGVAAIGCASILSIPERLAEWCDRPENRHDFCEDFDHTDAGGAWTSGTGGGAQYAFVPSSDTPPNALDFSAPAQALGSGAVAGLFQEFPDQKFDHVTVGADVRFVRIDLAAEAGVGSQLGFLLLEEQDFCMGVVLTPSGLGLVMRAHSMDCTSVQNVPVGAGVVTDDAGLSAYAPVGPTPNTNEWYHIKLDVQRRPDGSGAVNFDINFPGVVTAPQIPPGFLQEGPPAIAVATSIVGPTGAVELQFDNVTVDFGSN